MLRKKSFLVRFLSDLFTLKLYVFIILFFTVNLSSVGQADDRPYWRGPHGNGISFEKDWNPKALDGGAKINWQIKIGAGYSSVTVKDGLIYTLGKEDDNDIVYCLKEETGEEVWRFTYDCPVRSYPGTFSTPVTDGEYVYSMSRNGDVYCLNASTGKEKWHVNIVSEFGAVQPKYGFSGSPVIHKEALILVDGKFVVLNQWGELLIMEASEKGCNDISRAKVVETSSSVRCWTAPVLANGRIYVRTNTGELVCVDVS